jgi:cytochrome c peroxidase
MFRIVALLLLFASSSVAWAQTDDKPRREEPVVPLPATVAAPVDNPTTPEKVTLGKELFFDPRLSGDNTISCASCHFPDRAFGDGIAWNKGHGGATLTRNTQSCLNVGFYSNFFWDGRSASLEDQALGPIQSEVEMNQNLDELEKELNAVPGYVRRFQTVFGTKPNRDGIAKALAAYQRTLVTGPSPFDRYLQGDKTALSADAVRGWELFRGEAKCIQCHNGPLLSDGKFYRLGVSEEDLGRAQITGKKEDRYRFRTPTLRNVAETGPYMHDGSQKSLETVVTFYYRGIPQATTDGLPMDAPDLRGQSFADIPYLVAFLESLTGPAPDFTPLTLPPEPMLNSKTD